MKESNDIVEQVFKIIKNKEGVYYKSLFRQIEAEESEVRWAYTKLTKEYKLIVSYNQEFSLTEKGELYDTVQEYLESLKPKKEKLTFYQKIQLPVYIVFGLITATLAILNYQSKKNTVSLEEKNNRLEDEVDFLNVKYNRLKDDFAHYRDSVNKDNLETVKSTIELLNGTSKTKSSDDL